MGHTGDPILRCPNQYVIISITLHIPSTAHRLPSSALTTFLPNHFEPIYPVKARKLAILSRTSRAPKQNISPSSASQHTRCTHNIVSILVAIHISNSRHRPSSFVSECTSHHGHLIIISERQWHPNRSITAVHNIGCPSSRCIRHAKYNIPERVSIHVPSPTHRHSRLVHSSSFANLNYKALVSVHR